ncbi:MAG TPA: histidine kinase N-terminal 7TM domain-containing protein [Methanocella sp.]|nr:histidine kinase N-terminal 7TM domain-containing protein [Methanocella sp.]
MIFQYYPPAVFYLISVIIFGALSIYIWRRRAEPGGLSFFMLALAGIAWALSVTFEMMAVDISVRYFFNVILYASYLSVSSLWLLFTLEFGKQPKWLTLKLKIWIWVIAAFLMLLVITNSWHKLVWSNIVMVSGPAGISAVFQRGIVDWVIMGYLLAGTLIGTIILAIKALKSSELRRNQAFTLLLGATIPWIWSCIYIADLSPFPDLDLAPFFFAITALICSWGLFRQHLFDIIPVASKALIANMAEGMIVVDDRGRIVDVNPAAQRMLGVTNKVIGLPAETALQVWSNLRAGFQGGRETSVELMLDDNGDGDGSRWLDAHSSPLLDKHGHMNGLLIIIRDVTDRKQAAVALQQAYDELIRSHKALEVEVTERKKAEERTMESLKEKEVLLKEIHHRVKNNLQIISSLLNLQSCNSGKDNAAAFKESQNRIKSMALIHEQLYQSKDLACIDFAGYVNRLITQLVRSYMLNQHVSVAIEIADISLDIDTAIPCGLIINELVSNSLKYAFSPEKEAAIRIRMTLDGDRYTLIVADNGKGLPKNVDFHNTVSLGMQLVITLIDQLGGEIEHIDGEGAAFRLTFQANNHIGQ